jgi:SAM-dependent methyltransferase
LAAGRYNDAMPVASVPTPSLESSLRQARALQAHDAEGAARLYAEVLAGDPANLEAHNALERLRAPGCYGRWMGVDCRIHADDDIFRFFANYPESRNPIRDYLADGWRTLAELMVVLERVQRPLLQMGSVLEFASGYGRFTRHLAPLLPGRVSCADVMPGSAAFLRETFGVQAFTSAHRPEAVAFPARYELVFVLSLFTHLPLPMWRPWLTALAGALVPGGLLVFTAHNEAAGRAAGADYGADGVQFLPSSESPSLDAETYGTTFTTRAVVDAEVLAAFGKPALLHAEAAFWAGQDAVVIAP